MKQIPTSKITDLALGHLSSGESLKVLEEIEKSEEPSDELALVPNIINFFKRQNAGILAKKPWPLRSSGGSDTEESAGSTGARVQPLNSSVNTCRGRGL